MCWKANPHWRRNPHEKVGSRWRKSWINWKFSHRWKVFPHPMLTPQNLYIHQNAVHPVFTQNHIALSKWAKSLTRALNQNPTRELFMRKWRKTIKLELLVRMRIRMGIGKGGRCDWSLDYWVFIELRDSGFIFWVFLKWGHLVYILLRLYFCNCNY